MNLRSNRLEVFLRRWWSKKYQRPWTHELYQNSNEFDLLVEFYEDYYEENEAARLDIYRNEEGEVEFLGTGDNLLDKWEKELSQGLDPDLTEGLPQEELTKLDKEKTKINRAEKLMSQLDDLGGQVLGSKSNDKFNSKFARIGSKEESELLRSKLNPRKFK